MSYKISVLPALAIIISAPEYVAIFAAISFVAIPPVPTLLPVESFAIPNTLPSISVTSFMSSASGFLCGSSEYSPSISDSKIRRSAFVQDATYDEYPYKADIVLPEIGDSLVPTVIFSLADSESGNFAPVAESGAGYVRIWAKEKPEEAVVIPTILCQ